MEIILETERLFIRELSIMDVDAMFEMDSDPEVHKYLGNKPIHKKEEALAYIENTRKQYKENGIGRWAMILKETNEFVGWTGLRLYSEYTFNNHTNFHDIGYRLLRKHWGNGYATESAKACLKYAFDTLQLENVYGITELENEGSHRILLKIGLNYVENFHYPKEDMILRWYAINKSEFYGENMP